MEEKIKVIDGFKAVWEIFVTLLGKQKNNEVLKDLKIVKGMSAGFGYIVFLGFVLPAKILTFLLKPNWAWLHFVQRHLISPIFEIDALTGSESPSRLLGEIYEKNLNYFKTTKDSGAQASTLKPSISILERIMIFAKLRVLITLLIFAFFAIGVYEIFELFVSILGWVIVMIGSTFGISSSALFDIDTLFKSFSISVMFAWILWGTGALLISYLLMFAFRFVVQSFKSIMYADRKMLKDFVDDSLHYTITKSIELYGEDVALKAYDLLLENVVTEQERYTTDEPYYKRLEKPKKEPLRINDVEEA